MPNRQPNHVTVSLHDTGIRPYMARYAIDATDGLRLRIMAMTGAMVVHFIDMERLLGIRVAAKRTSATHVLVDEKLLKGSDTELLAKVKAALSLGDKQ